MIILQKYEPKLRVIVTYNPFINRKDFRGFKVFCSGKFVGVVVDSSEKEIFIRTIYNFDMIPDSYHNGQNEMDVIYAGPR